MPSIYGKNITSIMQNIPLFHEEYKWDFVIGEISQVLLLYKVGVLLKLLVFTTVSSANSVVLLGLFSI